MAKGHGKVGAAKSESVAALPKACASELAAVEFFETRRWGKAGPCCPRCSDTDVYKMTDRKTGLRNRRFLWLCRGCKRQFTVRVGTVLEESLIPLRHWAYAFWAGAASKKGVSSRQIQRMTGLSYKSALFMMHRVRFRHAGRLLRTAEAERNRGSRRSLCRRQAAQQTGASRTCEGLAQSEDPGCLAGRALLKRGIYGTFHNVSRKHLHRYAAEFDFRWNARKIDDGARTELAIRSGEGKRLRYRAPVAALPPTPAQGRPF